MNWQETSEGLYKKFEFKDFKEAFAFIAKVAEIAEEHQHHPTWANTWNTVEIWLTTHDQADSVTDKDRSLAAQIDSIVQ